MSAICVTNLVKRFAAHTVLAGVSFSVEKGEIVAVLGRSGTGKSVLLKTIIALMNPDSGTVEVFGQNLHLLSEQQRLTARRTMGYVFQGAALFDSLTVAENVGFCLYQDRLSEHDIRERVREKLAMVGLDHVIDKYPSELSGGMQKRVGLARTLITQPNIILFDEPTSGLDPVTTAVINQIILKLRSKLGVTSLVVTHDLSSAFSIADRIILLDHGMIVAIGTPSEIRATKNAWVQRFILGQADPEDLADSATYRPAVVPAIRNVRKQTDTDPGDANSPNH